MGEMCLNNRLKSFLELICSRLVEQNPDLIILTIKTFKFHDFWIFEPVEPHIYSFYILLYQNASNEERKYWDIFEAYHFCKSENQHFWKVLKHMHSFLLTFLVSLFYQILWRRAPENDEDPYIKFFKILDMNFISIKQHEMEIW